MEFRFVLAVLTIILDQYGQSGQSYRHSCLGAWLLLYEGCEMEFELKVHRTVSSGGA